VIRPEGLAKDAAVSEQFEASINDELARLKSTENHDRGRKPHRLCECENNPRKARRAALPGASLHDVVRTRRKCASTWAAINTGLPAAKESN